MGSFSLLPASTLLSSRAQIVDANGYPTFFLIHLFITWDTLLKNGFDQQTGQVVIKVIPDVPVEGRTEPISQTLQYLDSNGIMLGPGVDFARPYVNKNTDHIADGTGNPLAGGKVAYAAFVASGPIAGQTIEYNGSNWLPVAIAVTKAGVTSQWIRSYDAATGAFSSSQPAFTDISGSLTPGQLPTGTVIVQTVPVAGNTPRFDGAFWQNVQIAQTKAPITSQWLNSYDAATGLYISSQPNFADIAGTIANAQLPININVTGDLSVTGTITVTDRVNIGLTYIRSGSNLVLAASPGGGVLLNWENGGTGTFFGNGAGGNVGNIDNSGNFSVIGSKSFRITHPQDDTKWLTHSCLEGPENGVYYRGESETKDGKVVIMLPDYFEALTLHDQRTVQLTERYDDEDGPIFGCFLAAGRIRCGSFTVRSSVPTAKFYWEVKAVRGDIEPLIVVKNKTKEEINPAKAI